MNLRHKASGIAVLALFITLGLPAIMMHDGETSRLQAYGFALFFSIASYFIIKHDMDKERTSPPRLLDRIVGVVVGGFLVISGFVSTVFYGGADLAQLLGLPSGLVIALLAIVQTVLLGLWFWPGEATMPGVSPVEAPPPIVVTPPTVVMAAPSASASQGTSRPQAQSSSSNTTSVDDLL